jgi:hypothetical protein
MLNEATHTKHGEREAQPAKKRRAPSPRQEKGREERIASVDEGEATEGDMDKLRHGRKEG